MTEMFGRYRIESVLGEGGMGEVYQAFDTRNERTVALKRLRRGLADSAEYRTRFQRESRAAAGLASPHVVPIHDVGEFEGHLYIEMRLIHGRDLARAIADTGPLAPGRVAVIVGQVADALQSAHRAGMVHRDVKPSNVLLADVSDAERDFAYLVDFGVAKVVDGASTSLTGTGIALGTMAYMAPELFQGSSVDRRIDVYALACMAHEALTGTPPFTTTGPTLIYQHLSVEPPRASSVRPGVPAAADEVLLGGMAKDPAARYATAPEFAAALSGALVDPAPSAAPPGSVPAQNHPPVVSGPNPTVDVARPAQFAAAAGAPPLPPTYAPGHGTPPGGYGPGGYGVPGWPVPGPTAVGHPSGPQRPWYPPPGPGVPGPAAGQAPRRRMHPAVLVTITVLGTLVIGLGAVLGIGLVRDGGTATDPPASAAPVTPSAAPTPAPATDGQVPIPNATSDLALLRQVYNIGPECTTVATEQPSYVSLASLSCPDPANQATVYYDVWVDAAAARAFFDNVRNGRTSTGPESWTKGDIRQGPYWLGSAPDGRVHSVALYEGKRFTQYTVAPTGAQEDAAFTKTGGLDVAEVPN